MDKVRMKFAKDGDGNWFLIPETLMTRFRGLRDEMDTLSVLDDRFLDLCEDFSIEFSEYEISSPADYYGSIT